MNDLPCNLDPQTGRKWAKGRRKVINEAFACVKINHLLKDADRARADGDGVDLGRPPDVDGKADDVLTAVATKRASIILDAGETQKTCYAYA